MKDIIGLDLVFSGISGVAIADTENNLQSFGVLTDSESSSSDMVKKIKRGLFLTQAFDNAIEHFKSESVVVIEYPDWHQKPTKRIFDTKTKKFTTTKTSAGRDRVAVQSLSLSRGIILTNIFLSEKYILPVFQTVAETRKYIFGKNVSKERVFTFINFNYRLNFAKNDKNMNITDAIALTRTYNKVQSLPESSKIKQKLIQKEAVIREFLLSRPTLETFNFKDNLSSHSFYEENVDDNMIGSIDISSLNPGTVVINSKKELVFHKNFAVGKRSKVPELAELQTIEKIVDSFLTMKQLGVKKVLFEYSDWHREGKGLEFYIDVAAMNSLFFTYGVLMSLSAHYDLPIIPVGAKQAKKSALNKSNATKEEVKEYIQKLYPLTNEHTRDAMLIAYNYTNEEK